jgi:hypothetical protein
MGLYDDELPLEELDEQIEWYARARRPLRGSQSSPVPQLIQDLHRLYENEQADAQSVEEVRRRLIARGAIPPPMRQRSRPAGSPRSQPGAWQPPQRAQRPPRRRWSLASRLAAVAAAVVLVVLIGGLTAGLVLVRPHTVGTHLASPTPDLPTPDLPTLTYIGSDDNIWTMTWPGGTPKQLTTDAHGQPTYSGLAWSPDGALLAVAKGLDSSTASPSILVLKPDGTVVVRIPFGAQHYWIPFAWSPDSKMIAYRSPDYMSDNTYNDPVTGTLVIVDAHTGKTLKTVPYMAGRYGCDGDSGLRTPLAEEIDTVHHLNPEDQEDLLAWSPDQRSMLVGQECNSGPVAQVDLSSGTTNSPFPYGGGYQPGGNLILGYWFDGTLGLTDLSGNHVRALIPSPGNARTLGVAVWTSDGKAIYYEHDYGIWRIEVDGSNPHQVVAGTAPDSQHPTTIQLVPHPSPDGHLLLYLQASGGDTLDLGDGTPPPTPPVPLTTRWYVAQADGTNPVPLPPDVTQVVWRSGT